MSHVTLQTSSEAMNNRDINPSDELASAYPDLVCLLKNAAISVAFARHENVAMRWKRIYTSFGRISLIAVMLAMVSFDYQITLKPLYGAPPFLSIMAAACAATGLFSQMLLLVTHAKDRWLAARFAAERIRCFKFQLFTVVEEVADVADLATRIRQRTQEGLVALQEELRGGRAAILEFSPFHVMAPPRHKVTHPSRKLTEEASAVYDILRFSVESQHFENSYRDHDLQTKFPSLLSELSFLAGAMLACIGILTTLLPAATALHRILSAGGVMEWVDFLTWMLFVLSAVVAIYERGSANQPNAERYVTYGREIRRIRSGAANHLPGSFFEAVREMEHLMLREIQDFCRDVRHSNYIF